MAKAKKNIKILFISPVPLKGAGCRFRIAQLLPHLEKYGFEGAISPFYSDGFFDVVYKPKHYTTKAFYFLISISRRIYDIVRCLAYDIVFIYREACPVGPPIFEWIFSRVKPVVYDFDDAIYLNSTSDANKFIRFLKFPQKVRHIIKLSSHIIVCNDFLKRYAVNFNSNVSIIPTSVDTDIFISVKNESGPPKQTVIGWIGTHTTAKYLLILRNVFEKLAKKYDFTLKLIGVDSVVEIPGVKVINQTWSLEREVSDYQNLDIGIYPLEGGEWDLGKTGFKTVVYMSVGVPPVVSSVGSNKEIIEDGANGLLANSESEWIDKISRLIENYSLRRSMGEAARETVVRKYSIKANISKYVDVFNSVLKHEKIQI